MDPRTLGKAEAERNSFHSENGAIAGLDRLRTEATPANLATLPLTLAIIVLRSGWIAHASGSQGDLEAWAWDRLNIDPSQGSVALLAFWEAVLAGGYVQGSWRQWASAARGGEARGQVQIREQANERRAQRGATVPAGAIVRTGANGNAVLVRGREFVTLRRNSQIRIPAANAERSVIQVLQDWGSALFDIGKQPNPHFGVETPYLAAVVKGTSFTITVASEGASMQVLEGTVEVATLDGGARDLVMPGAVAMIAAEDRLRLVVEGSERKVLDSPARPAGSSKGTGSGLPVSNPFAPGGPSASLQAEPVDAGGNQAISGAFSSEEADFSDLSGGFVAGETMEFAAEVVADAAIDARSGPGGKGPDDKGPEDEGPDDKGPDEKGPDDEGPDDEGPDTKGPDDEGPDDSGPDDSGPDEKDPRR